tara:strand:+ start:528 stop:851 length:324 start_codon:yes stop_codon:yes gene_type:complete
MQQELPFSLLDLQGRTVLTVKDVAERLHCTTRHVCELIDAEELAAINISKGRSRLHARIPVEAFREFVVRGMTCDFEVSPLRHLPVQSLIRWHRELTQHLRAKGIRV